MLVYLPLCSGSAEGAQGSKVTQHSLHSIPTTRETLQSPSAEITVFGQAWQVFFTCSYFCEDRMFVERHAQKKRSKEVTNADKQGNKRIALHGLSPDKLCSANQVC